MNVHDDITKGNDDGAYQTWLFVSKYEKSLKILVS